MAISIVSNPYSGSDDTAGAKNPTAQNPTTIEESLPINSESIDTIAVDAKTEEIEEPTSNTQNTEDDSSRIQSYHPEENILEEDGESKTTEENKQQDLSEANNTEVNQKIKDSEEFLAKTEETIVDQNPIDDIFAGTVSSTNETDEAAHIPNLYIQADQEKQTHEQTTQESQNQTSTTENKTIEEENEGFDMDDLLGSQEQTAEEMTTPNQDNIQETVTQNSKQDTHNNDAPSPTTDPFVQSQHTTKEATTTQEATPQPAQESTPKQQSSTIKRLALIAVGCFGILVLWFVIKTMFPAGIGTSSQLDPVEKSIVDVLENNQDIDLEEEIAEHGSDMRTEEEILIDELQEYTAVGTSFYELGRELKDRNMVRYALYIEKRSQDLLDELASNPDMDTSDVEALFRQFDDYLQTLREWQEQSGETLPTVERPDTQTGQDMIDVPQEEEEVDTITEANNPVEDTLQDIPGFNSVFSSSPDDTNPRSTEQQPESEQSELSDG